MKKFTPLVLTVLMLSGFCVSSLGSVTMGSTPGVSLTMPSASQAGEAPRPPGENRLTINISPGGHSAQVILVNQQYHMGNPRITFARVIGGGISTCSACGGWLLQEAFNNGDVLSAATFHADPTSGVVDGTLTYTRSDFPATYVGAWLDGSTHFLGLETIIGSDHYYGYLQMRVTDAITSPTIAIDGYAWENNPHTPITMAFVPEPSSALLSAMGFALYVRRKRSAASMSPCLD